jgi:hypothetical protein
LLDRRSLDQAGLFDAAAVARAWRRHDSGRADLSAELWCVLMFQAWAQRYRVAL